MNNHPTNKTILLIEDSSAYHDLMSFVLEILALPHNLFTVLTGEEALAFLYHQGKYAHAPRPNLILLDLNLPKMSGFDVLSSIKSEPIFNLIPVIIFSSSSLTTDIEHSYQLQANSYIKKPRDLDQLIEVVGEMLKFWFNIVETLNFCH